VALKCADIGNPCRPWKLSRRWGEMICQEFYLQGMSLLDHVKSTGIECVILCC